MGADWDWQVFFQSAGDYPTYWQWMVSAWGWSAAVAALSLALAFVLGSVVGIIRTLPNRPCLAFLGTCWVELFRNIPLLVQIFLWYHVLPEFVPALKTLSSFLLVVIALGIYSSVRVGEQVRAGILALPRGQRYAGMALGFTTVQYYRYVILPMAYRIVIPTLTSEAMNVFKNSSVAFAVSVTELTWFAMQVGEETARPVEVYAAVTALYGISAFLINRVMAVIERRARVPGLVVAGSAGGH
ncbi:amino acid ABC transporter permease [Paraburkholderia bannensis]|uniref:amino acid ABC transporter permease n=1 Tax=Paraburkholderia bannensis TaxID=765414 RepID=UPI002ABD2870|nr:amino acid ABC transporter permease [Paraburkholderia bannensis]